MSVCLTPTFLYPPRPLSEIHLEGLRERCNLVHYSIKIRHLLATIFYDFAKSQLTKFRARYKQ